MKKRFLPVLVRVIVLLTCWFYVGSVFGQRDATATDTFPINNKNDLLNFMYCLNKSGNEDGGKFYYYNGFYTSNSDLETHGYSYITIAKGGEGTNFKLTQDIIFNTGDVAGCDGNCSGFDKWELYGGSVFKGNFDGRGHVISGLYVNGGMGFFSEVQGNVKIKNLGIVNAYIKGTNNVGGVVGKLNFGTVSNCFFEGCIEIIGESPNNVGGIVGQCLGTGCTVDSCYATGHLHSNGQNVGGIAGYIDGNSHIRACYSTMIIQCGTNSSTTGGICGQALSVNNISNCFFDKQMSSLDDATGATGKLTRELMATNFSALGSAFVTSEADYYPYLNVFGFSKPAVKFSCLPLKLADADNYVDNLLSVTAAFTLPTMANVSWGKDNLWPSAVTVSDNTVTPVQQGSVRFTATLADDNTGHTRYYDIVPNKAPFVGSEANPFTIDSLANLKDFRDGINSGSDFTYKRFTITRLHGVMDTIHWKQTADIDMGNTEWTPIGKDSTIKNSFRGIYDGGDHQIQNLKLQENQINQAFFRYPNGTIQNLVMMNPQNFEYQGNSAILATFVMGGTIDNCSVTYNNDAGKNLSFNGSNCGGLVGWVGYPVSDPYVPAGYVTISNCHNDCNITNSDTVHFGGVVGHVYADSCSIIRCYNTGDLIAKEPTNESTRPDNWGSIGGVVGICEDGSGPNKATVTFCYNTGNITGRSGFIGGVVGLATEKHSISHCFNTGNVTGVQTRKLDFFTVGGVVAPYNATVRYCFNAGKVTVNDNNNVITYAQGVAGVNSYCEHCFNVGEITNGNTTHGEAGGVAGHSVYGGDNLRGTASYCYNANRVYDRNTDNLHPHSVAYNVTNSFTDKQMAINAQDGTLCTTSQLIGTESIAKEVLGTEHWIYETGRYPRLKWTDTCTWAKDIAIAACCPVLLPNANDDIDHVKPGMKLGCATNVTWTAPSNNCLFDGALPTNCENNYIQPSLQQSCTTLVPVSAEVGGKVVKTLSLLRYLGALDDTLHVNNLTDLKNLRDGVNSDAAFTYHDTLVPRFAEGCVFLLTDNIDLSQDNTVSDWTPIGSGSTSMRFGGTFLGGGKTISNLRITNGQTVAGLFGILSGEVRDLNIQVDTIEKGSYAGAVCGAMDNGKIESCTTTGGTIIGAPYEEGTLHYGTAGIAGVSLGHDTIIGCVNYATVISDYCGAGIIGEGAHVFNSANVGDIIGKSNCAYLGGVGGKNTAAQSCFNTGMVTAEPGNSTAYNWVGGVVAKSDSLHGIRYCYNAGIVDGGNRFYTGGICGDGKPIYCYNSNTVRSTGGHLGSIVGNYNEDADSCYYDKQFSTVGGMNGIDQPGQMVKGFFTDKHDNNGGMIGNSLVILLGDCQNYWHFAAELYPQLQKFTANGNLSYASVMPVLLDYVNNNEFDTYNSVRDTITIKACGTDNFWERLKGNCLKVENCKVTIADGKMGIVELGASVNGIIYRKIRLLVNISEENPLLIRNINELQTFREIINNGLGYYKIPEVPEVSIDNRYQLTLSHEDSTYLDNFVEITDGGRDLFFKLTQNIDLSSVTAWTPIGNYSTNHPNQVFKGHFNGDNKTITGLHLDNKVYQGFFGYVSAGTVKNLKFQSATLSNAGNYRGVVCGYNLGGTIQDCEVIGANASELAGDSVGLVCGANFYGRILRCDSKNSRIQSNSGKMLGGICGYNAFGSIDSCLVTGLTVTDYMYYVGGIVGDNYRGKVMNDTLRNSTFTSSTSMDNKYVGGIAGYTGGKYLYDFANHAIVENCVCDTTVFNVNGSSIGGITGMLSRANEQFNYITNCRTRGGSINADDNFVADTVGGIVGKLYYFHENSRILRCFNQTPVYGRNMVGGIAGALEDGQIDSCGNYGNVTASNDFAGGIAGDCTENGFISNSFNTGLVTAVRDCAGGIAGRMHSTADTAVCHVLTSFNSGYVKGRNQVGGIVGRMFKQNYFKYCYNTGVVKGVAQVGGLVGEIEDPTAVSGYSYSAGWVESSSMAGAVCGFTSDTTKLQNCHYDKQMCSYKGVNEQDVTGVTGHLTNEMTGTQLQNSLGNDTWEYETGMYPRLKAFAGSNAGVASALTAKLGTSYAYNLSVNVNYAVSTSEGISWKDEPTLVFSKSADFTLSSDKRSMKVISASKGDTTYRYMKFSFGISEMQPIVISNLTELQHFRNLVNAGDTFYYTGSGDFVSTKNTDYTVIAPLGDGYFFKLTANIDASGENWVPIGSEAKPFKGYFDGDKKNVTITINNNSDCQGLFGYMQGRVSNLYMKDAVVTGRDSVGAIAGYCHGTIDSCGVLSSCDSSMKVTGRNHVGGLVGQAFYSQILNSYNGRNVVGERYVGGIVGDLIADDPAGATDAYAGAVSRCFNYGIITASGVDSSKVGGLVGASVTEVSHSYNTGIVNGVKCVGGLVGWCNTRRLQYGYNAGYVNATATSNKHAGAITSGDNTSYVPKDCYYDLQNCPLDGGIGRSAAAINSVGQSTALLTKDIVGDALKPVFGEQYWDYSHNNKLEYPRLKTIADTPSVYVSVKPVFLNDRMPVNNVVQPFHVLKGNTSDGKVAWARYGTAAMAVKDPVSLTNNILDSVPLNTCGDDSLKVCYPEVSPSTCSEYRVVPLVIKATGATVVYDTACVSKEWHDVTYSKSGFYTYRAPNTTCGEVEALDLTIMPEIEVTFEKTDQCHDAATGSATATATGGFGDGFTYRWTTAAGDSIDNKITVNGLSEGKYYLYVTDIERHHCTVKDSVEIGKMSQLVLDSISQTNLTCRGASNGDVTVHVSGGTPPYNYRVGSGEYGFNVTTTDSTFTGLAAGTYTVWVADSCGAEKSVVFVLKEPEALSMTNETPVEIQCHGGKGSVRVHVTGGTKPYQYKLDTGDYGAEVNTADSTFANLGAGSHTITVKDACDSVRTYTHNFEQPSALTVINTTTRTDTTYCVNETAEIISVSAENGTAPYSYTWYGNGVELTSVTNAYYTPSTTTGGSDSTFYVVVKDACGATVTVNPVAHVKVWSLPIVNVTSINRDRVACMSDITEAVSDTNALADLGFHFSQGHNINKNVTVVSNTFTGDKCFGTQTTVYRATDACGNSVDVTYIQTVKDSLAPTVTGTLAALTVSGCAVSAAPATNTIAYLTANGLTISDNCTSDDELVVTSSDGAVSGTCQKTFTRTYVITDKCGNSAMTTQSVTVKDEEYPTFTVPAPITICRNADNTYTITPDVTGNVTDAADNCSTVVVTYQDADAVENTDGTLTIVRTWKATDACGKETEKEQTITVNPLPTISAAPISQTITYGETITPVVITNTYSNMQTPVLPAELSYNSSTQTISGKPAAAGTYTITATAVSNTDPNCGTVTQEITIQVDKKYPLTLTLDSTKLYDAAKFGVTYNQLYVSGLVNGDVLVSGTMLSESEAIGVYENHDGSFQATLDAGIINKSGFAIHNTAGEDVTSSYTPVFDVKLTILPSTITITAATDSKVYDGTPLINSGYELTDGVLAFDDELTFCEVTGSQLCLGTSDNVPSNAVIMRGNTDVTSFYTINYVNGTLTVTEPSGFECPQPEHFYLNDCETSMEVTLTGTPTLPNIAAGHYTVTNNLTPLSEGTHTVTWTLLDDCGNELATCGQTVTVDYKPCTGVEWQGYTYGAVRVGSQCWLNENIRWATGVHTAYGGNGDNVGKFGYLYTWYTAVGVEEDDDTAVPETKTGTCGDPYVQGICPDNWGVGSEADFALLNTTAGTTDRLKDPSTLYWQSGYEGVTNGTGFNARGGGWYNSSLARFEDLMTGYHFWRSDSTPGSTVFGSSINYWCGDIVNTQHRKTDKMSVRCIRKVMPE